MISTDPFFVVKAEVQRTIESINLLYSKLNSYTNDPLYSDDLEKTIEKIKSDCKSIEWDIEDLDETIKISEKNPKRFNLDFKELNERKEFVNSTKNFLQKIKESLSNQQTNSSNNISKEKQKPTYRNLFLLKGPGNGQKINYTLLKNEGEDNNEQFFDDTAQQQKHLIKAQDEQLNNIGSSVNMLKHMSYQIGTELDEQSVMLDDFAKDMDHTDSKLDSVMKKMAKVLHMSNDRRQWIAIGILLLILFIVIILLAVL